MNSYMYVGMAMVKKERGQDDYFSQQSKQTFHILQVCISATVCQKTYVGW